MHRLVSLSLFCSLTFTSFFLEIVTMADCCYLGIMLLLLTAGSIHNSTNSALVQTNPDIAKLLESALTWDFDVIKLENITSQRSVQFFGRRLISLKNRKKWEAN